MSESNHRFQVDLGGMIDLLANHLYSTPRVYIRELLQNGTDAISARRAIDPAHPGHLHMEVMPADADDGRAQPTLMFEDDGVGLTEAEVHQFLATIGQSSKRGDVDAARGTYIGQFGIGLLSCFMVCDEIVAITRSARTADAPVLEWRGRPDGTYSIRTLERSMPPGTRLYLRAKASCAELMSAATVIELARHYGELLPYPIDVVHGDSSVTINAVPPPWRRSWPSPAAERQALLAYGKRRFDMDFFDALPLHSHAGAVDGVAFVLPHPTNLGARPQHAVYVKNMLMTEAMEDLLPGWAFFVRCVVNAGDLQPTASRESFYEDERLELARHNLGHALQAYLRRIATEDPGRFRTLVELHFRAIKSLATEDDDLLRLFADGLPFETTMGTKMLRDIRDITDHIRYVDRVDRFRQVSRVATAQGMLLINAGYSHDVDILSRLPNVFPELFTEQVDPADIGASFKPPSPEEREAAAPLLTRADEALEPFGVQAEMRRFEPPALAALYIENEAAEFLRSARRSREAAAPNALFASLMDNLIGGRTEQARTTLYLNLANPLIGRLMKAHAGKRLDPVICTLYVQALLLGHYPLGDRELSVLNDSLTALMGLGLGDDEDNGNADDAEAGADPANR